MPGEFVWVEVRSRPVRGFWSAQLFWGPETTYRQLTSEQADEVLGEELLIGAIVDEADVPEAFRAGIAPAQEPPLPPAPPVDADREPGLPRGAEEDATGTDSELTPAAVAESNKRKR